MSVRQPPAYLTRRARAAVLTTALSTGLLLFLLGLFAGLGIMGNAYVGRVRADLEFRVFLFDGIPGSSRLAYEDSLRALDFVASLRFVSKEEAAALMQEITGADESSLLANGNPYPASYRVRLAGGWQSAEKVEEAAARLRSPLIVSEVVYPADQIARAIRNLNRIAWLLLAVGLFLTATVVYIVFATIRLGIYARRLTIRSMQLIGARPGFIRRPFLLSGLLQGGLGGLLAALLLLAAFSLLGRCLAEGNLLPFPASIAMFGGIVLLGLLLGLAGSYAAVSRFLDRHPDELV